LKKLTLDVQDYNKFYVPVTVTRWLESPGTIGLSEPESRSHITVLAYVDEHRTGTGRISREYIGRMNRAIRESVQLGIPQPWVDSALRPHVPADIFPAPDYVGTAEGYVPPPAAGTEVE